MVNVRLPYSVGTFESAKIFGTRICSTSHTEALECVATWVREKRSRYVCFCNVHMIMEAYDDPLYQAVVNSADLVTPDGMPVVWYLRHHGFPQQERVTGPDLMIHLLNEANRQGWKLGLLGGEPETLEILRAKLALEYPDLNLVYAYSPPFRELTQDEDSAIIGDISRSEVQVLLIGLGCPKQERWMADHSKSLNCVMLGVGAAFQFSSGQVRKAPEWLQRSGMEWFFRMCMEPKRLWKRYAKHNPRFVWLILKESMGLRRRSVSSISAGESPK